MLLIELRDGLSELKQVDRSLILDQLQDFQTSILDKLENITIVCDEMNGRLNDAATIATNSQNDTPELMSSCEESTSLASKNRTNESNEFERHKSSLKKVIKFNF